MAKSLRKDGITFSDVVIRWFRVGKRQPPLAYGKLIADYHGLDELPRIYTERFVDELFTAEEVAQLDGYLENTNGQTLELHAVNGSTLHKAKVNFPLNGTVYGYSDRPIGGHADYFLLARQSDYDLPFQVHGYFDLTQGRYAARVDQSVSYLRRALQSLGVDAGIKKDEIRTVAEKLYQRNRFYVAQETTYDDWLTKIKL